MAGSTWGQVFRLTTFGESHGAGIGGVVDGCPAGLPLDEGVLQAQLDRRKPGNDFARLAGTTRRESDTVRILSGVFEGLTTGTPIGFFIANENQRSGDYGNLAELFRPGHGDMSYFAKYGVRDYRGGGRSSGRETAARVAGGAIAQVLLAAHGITVKAATIELAGIPAGGRDFDGAASRQYFAADEAVIPQWVETVKRVREEGDTVGGIVEIRAQGVPAGLGEPVFHKLDGMLAGALMSVGAVKGVEIGAGFAAARSRGSCNNDSMLPAPDGGIAFASNNAGGILAGISSGQEIIARAAVKPIASIAQEQHSVDKYGQPVTFAVGGRHDICAIPRVVPVLQAMTALTLADALLQQRRMEPVHG